MPAHYIGVPAFRYSPDTPTRSPRALTVMEMNLKGGFFFG